MDSKRAAAMGSNRPKHVIHLPTREQQVNTEGGHREALQRSAGTDPKRTFGSGHPNGRYSACSLSSQLVFLTRDSPVYLGPNPVSGPE